MTKYSCETNCAELLGCAHAKHPAQFPLHTLRVFLNHYTNSQAKAIPEENDLTLAALTILCSLELQNVILKSKVKIQTLSLLNSSESSL